MSDEYELRESEYFYEVSDGQGGGEVIGKWLVNDDCNCVGVCDGNAGQYRGDGTCKCSDTDIRSAKCSNPFIEAILRSLRAGRNFCTFRDDDIAILPEARRELMLLHLEFADFVDRSPAPSPDQINAATIIRQHLKIQQFVAGEPTDVLRAPGTLEQIRQEMALDSFQQAMVVKNALAR